MSGLCPRHRVPLRRVALTSARTTFQVTNCLRCRPYDVLSDAQRVEYLARSPYTSCTCAADSRIRRQSRSSTERLTASSPRAEHRYCVSPGPTPARPCGRDARVLRRVGARRTLLARVRIRPHECARTPPPLPRRRALPRFAPTIRTCRSIRSSASTTPSRSRAPRPRPPTGRRGRRVRTRRVACRLPLGELGDRHYAAPYADAITATRRRSAPPLPAGEPPVGYWGSGVLVARASPRTPFTRSSLSSRRGSRDALTPDARITRCEVGEVPAPGSAVRLPRRAARLRHVSAPPSAIQRPTSNRPSRTRR